MVTAPRHLPTLFPCRKIRSLSSQGSRRRFRWRASQFLLRQLTTRYESDRPKDGWQAIDTISADLSYEDGHENYTNIKVGNKPEKSMEDAAESWSTGEFASLLDDLFDPYTAATFRKTGQDTISGRGATTFKFDVTREHSHWRVSIAGQLYYPAFRGTVWIDRETSRVLRLEIESRNMPLLFPLAKVEEAWTTNSYGWQRPSHSCCPRLRSAELPATLLALQP